jgi:spermidine/putrescine transport system permease protein
MSLIISVVAVAAAYPIAYYIALVASKRKYVLLLLILAPFLVSYFLRLLAWKVILGDQGVINSFLMWTGIRDEPVTWLLYSQFAVILTLIYVYIPFVALPIFASLEALDRRLLEAASDLGASRWQAFRKVTLPLSLPGVIAAFIFVFIPTIGEYFAPLLVGGVDGTMFGNAIADQFGQSLNWLNGSVLSFFLLVVVAVLMGVFARFLTVRRVATG